MWARDWETQKARVQNGLAYKSDRQIDRRSGKEKDMSTQGSFPLPLLLSLSLSHGQYARDT